MKAGGLKLFILGLSVATSLAASPALADQDAFRQLFTYRYPKQQAIRIDADMMATCLAVKVKKSKSGYYFDRRFSDSSQTFNDFVEYLGAASNRKYDFMTGRESALREWILSRPENSIDPYILFGASLSFNNGNIFDAVLTIHQLVRNEARFINPRRYRYDSDLTKHQQFFDRLIDIRGDLVERGPGYNGDHGGSWYRMWGTMLYEMMWMPEVLAPQSHSLTLKQKTVATFGNGLGQALSGYVEMSKFISPKEIDVIGKIEMGQVGAKAAHRLMNKIWGKREFQVTEELERICANRTYLRAKRESKKEENPLLAAMVPKVDLTDQMSLTLTQQGGTCYAYAFTGAVEAALYRKDKARRQISPDFLYTRVFANGQQDSVRLIKTLLGNSYADGQIGGKGSNMFDLLAKTAFTSPYYVEDADFRPALDQAIENKQKDSALDVLKISLKLSRETSKDVEMYQSLYRHGLKHLKSEPALRELKLAKHWIKRDENQNELLPLLSHLLRANVPPIVVFYYDLDKTQINRSGGNSWVPLPQGLLSMPVWHAVVLQKIEKSQDGNTYLIFRDSYATGTNQVPNMSQIRMKVQDAQNLITQVFSVTGTWDSI